MVLKGRLDFGHDTFTKTLVGYHDHRMEVMRQATEITKLLVGKGHVMLPDVVNWG
jgi:hypothetical protein